MTRTWSESLGGPASLGVAPDVAIATIEDPGAVELRAEPSDTDALAAIAARLGAPLPSHGVSVMIGGMRLIGCGPGRWRMLGTREEAAHLPDRLVGIDHVTDLTGALSLLRVVGPAGNEILMKLTPLDIGAVEPDTAPEATLAGVTVLLIREEGRTPSWLVAVPRSCARHVAEALVGAARVPHRAMPFRRQEPPPV